jgi:deoxycytidylate deaminase
MGCLLVKAGYDDVNGDDCIGQNDCTGDGKVELQHQHQGKGKGTATTETNATTDIYKSLVSVATNQSLYKPNESDIHAEIVAISTAARYGRPTNGTTAFITMPPCKKCLGALISAGITKIVSRYRLNTSERIDACQLANIEYVDFGKERSDECEARVKNLIPPDPTIEEKRKIRREKKQHKQEEADGNAGDESCTIEAGAAVTSGRGSSTCNTAADINTNKIRNGSLTETTSPSQTEQSAYEGKRKRDEE